MIYSALVQCLLKTVPMLISANRKFLQNQTRMYPTISSTSSPERKSPSHLPRQKRWLQEANSKAQAEFATKNGINSDEDNAETSNSKNDKSIRKVAVKQTDQKPSFIVKL